MKADKPQLAFRLLNVAALGVGWCIAISGMLINVSTTTVASSEWKGVAYATLPVGLHAIGAAFAVIPTAHLAKSYGRRVVFVGSALLAMCGACIMVAAAYKQEYIMLVFGAFLQGPAFAVGNNFRFVSAEFLTGPGYSPEWRGRAISLSVGTAVFAAAVGPESARTLRDRLDTKYAASYVLLACLYLAQAIITGCVAYGWLAKSQAQQLQQQQPQGAVKPKADAPPAAQQDADAAGGDVPVVAVVEPKAAPAPAPAAPQDADWLRRSLMNANFLMPAVAGAMAFCNMAALMVATPIAMKEDGYNFNQSTWVIEAHIVGMFLPGMLVGDVIALTKHLAEVLPTFGTQLLLMLPFRQPAPSPKAPPSVSAFPPTSPSTVVLVWGGIVLLVCNGLCLVGPRLPWYFSGLTLLGVGWALVYVTASSLVTAIFVRDPRLRFAVQGSMDTLVVFCSAVSNTLSGPLVRAMGWSNFVYLNLAANAFLTAWCATYHVLVAKRWHKQQAGL